MRGGPANKKAAYISITSRKDPLPSTLHNENNNNKHQHQQQQQQRLLRRLFTPRSVGSSRKDPPGEYRPHPRHPPQLRFSGLPRPFQRPEPLLELASGLGRQPCKGGRKGMGRKFGSCSVEARGSLGRQQRGFAAVKGPDP